MNKKIAIMIAAALGLLGLSSCQHQHHRHHHHHSAYPGIHHGGAFRPHGPHH